MPSTTVFNASDVANAIGIFQMTVGLRNKLYNGGSNDGILRNGFWDLTESSENGNTTCREIK